MIQTDAKSYLRQAVREGCPEVVKVMLRADSGKERALEKLV